MPSLMLPGFRRALVAVGLCAGVLLAVAPASADNGRRSRHYRSGHSRSWHPRVAVFVGLPAVVLRAGHDRYREPYYRDERGYEYEDGYDAGYDDGYDDRTREEWRRREHYRRHRHHDHHGCDY